MMSFIVYIRCRGKSLYFVVPRMKSSTQNRHWPDRQYQKIGIGQTEQTFSRPLARPNRTLAGRLSRPSARPLCRPWARPNRPYARPLSRPSARPLSIPLARPNRLLARPSFGRFGLARSLGKDCMVWPIPTC